MLNLFWVSTLLFWSENKTERMLSFLGETKISRNIPFALWTVCWLSMTEYVFISIIRSYSFYSSSFQDLSSQIRPAYSFSFSSKGRSVWEVFFSIIIRDSQAAVNHRDKKPCWRDWQQQDVTWKLELPVIQYLRFRIVLGRGFFPHIKYQDILEHFQGYKISSQKF